MSTLKLTTSGGGGGTVSLTATASTTGNAQVSLTLPQNDGDASQYLQTDGSGALSWATVSTDPTTTSGTNNFTVADGNLVIGTAGHGIDFSATADATDTSELLDDYEEGTWTPAFKGTSSDPSVTYGNQAGHYEKIGRFVHCYWIMNVTNANWASDGTGYLCIGGFPYTPEGMILYYMIDTYGWTVASGNVPQGGYTDSGSTSAGAMNSRNTAGNSLMSWAQRTGNVHIYTTCTYKTAT